MNNYALLATGLLLSSLALAGAHEFQNAKFHCVILKNGKAVKQQNCTADGYEHAGAGYGGGHGYNFRPIQGYGDISIDAGVSFSDSKMDKDGSPMIEKEWANLNNKPAIMRWRTPKTFKIATPQQVENDNGTLYTCYIHKKNAKYEFCYLPK